MRKIRIRKRKPGEYENLGLSDDRPWMVSNDPVDSRVTCWPNLGSALAWATMDPLKRRDKINHDDKMDGGW
jgi:hypothetical protein